MDSSGGDTLAGDTVSIQVPADGPYGVSLRPDENGNAAVVHAFDKLPNGKFGPIQKHGGVHYGDILTEINDTPLCNVSHAESLQMLANKNTLKKILKFQSPKVYYRKKNTMSYKAQPLDVKNSFLSAVKQSRISEIGGKKFTDYEIACQYRLVGTKVQTEVVYQWSVWKRYSEFEVLHGAVKKALGWQMDGIDLPSAHTFVMNKLAPEFVDQRRSDLKDYWQKVVAIDKVTDFAKHHCSEAIKAFLEVDQNTRNKEVAATADLIEESEDTAGGEDQQGKRTSMSPSASGAPSRRGSVRTNSRRISSKSLGTVNNTLAITAAPAEAPTAAPAPAPAAPSSSAGTAAPERAAAPSPPPRPSAPSPPPPQVQVQAAAPPPPARPSPAAPVVAAAPAPAPAAPSGGGGGLAGLPPKTAARANLLGSIAALRKD